MEATFDQRDIDYMRQAIALATRGTGRTNPNPLVGAIIVRDGEVLGQGWHACYGKLHAERNALADCANKGNDPTGATIYVTLEPCNHQGHQPPCVDALIEAGIKRVVVGSRDPNPLVNGKGNARLRAAGIEVVEDVLREECDAINQLFFHYMTVHKPYVIAKWGMSADGRIACASGDSKWVTGEFARAHGHALRNRLAAIMVGAGTVRADNPVLTCRLDGGRNPLRIVCDSQLTAVTEASALVRTIDQAPLLVAYADAEDNPQIAVRAQRLYDLGVDVINVPDATGHVDLPALMTELVNREIDSVLLEGGARLHAAALQAGIVNEIAAYVAQKVIGGVGAPGPVAGEGAQCMVDAIQLGPANVGQLGDDIRISWRLGSDEHERSLPCVSAQDLGPVWDAARASLIKAGE